MSELKIRECRLDGRYDIRDCLGRGSYSEVYVAEDLAAGEGEPRAVVIKALNPFLQGVPDAELERTLIENFRNEAVALDRVRHPNIISRLGHGTAIDLQDRVFHYLVVEYLPGGDLQALCRRHPLPLADALHYLEQVSDGLEHAHRNGVIHRDIKPQNLLLTADRQTVKIADFGVAKIEAAEGAITRVGTDVYAAPEHHPLMRTGPLDAAARAVRHLTPAADIYSLAKTTYMLLTGEAPRRFAQKPIEDLPAPMSDAPWASHVLRVLRRATRDDPSERHQSVREFWDELRDAALPKTQLLDETDAGVRRFTSPLGPRRPGVMTPAPPAPTFATPAAPTRPRPDQSQRQRIVVPFADEAPGGRLAEAERNGRARAQSPSEADAAPEDISYAEPRPTGRLKKWLVALLLLAAFAGMLFATQRYFSRLRSRGGDPARTTNPARDPAVGRELIAATDVNLRGGPTRNTPKVGLVEKNSVVRVLDVSGNWYKVTVIEHGRPKEDPESADEGWVGRSRLREK